MCIERVSEVRWDKLQDFCQYEDEDQKKNLEAQWAELCRSPFILL
jgi:hypothetical protein